MYGVVADSLTRTGRRRSEVLMVSAQVSRGRPYSVAQRGLGRGVPPVHSRLVQSFGHFMFWRQTVYGYHLRAPGAKVARPTAVPGVAQAISVLIDRSLNLVVDGCHGRSEL
jgi:hypothetical protein